jgi:hypothetical protein
VKNKVVRQLNVLTTSDAGTGDEWEVLTDDMGCLEMDAESEEDLEEGLRVYDRSPTPYPEPDDANYKAHDLSQKHREIFTDSSRSRQRQVIKNTSRSYHAIPIRREGNQIIFGQKHQGDFIQQGDKYFTPDHHELMVIEKIPATLQQEQEMLGLIDQAHAKHLEEVLSAAKQKPTMRQGCELLDTLNQRCADHLEDKNDEYESYVESEEADSEEEDFYNTEEQRPFKEARMIIAHDGQGLTGLNRQIANASFTEAEWRRVTFYHEQEANCATREELELYNRHESSRSKPDWNRQPSPTTTIRSYLLWRDARNPKHSLLPWQQWCKGSCKKHYMKKVEVVSQ